MNWLNARYEQERHQDEIRALQYAAQVNELLAQTNKHKGNSKRVRRAVGSKLVAWGERLQDTPSLKPSTSKP